MISILSMIIECHFFTEMLASCLESILPLNSRCRDFAVFINLHPRCSSSLFVTCWNIKQAFSKETASTTMTMVDAGVWCIDDCLQMLQRTLVNLWFTLAIYKNILPWNEHELSFCQWSEHDMQVLLSVVAMMAGVCMGPG